MRRAKNEDTARADRDFLPGLRIAPDALPFPADGKTAEGRNLDHIAALQRAGNLGNHRLDEFGRLVTREPDLLIDRLGELSTGNRVTGHEPLPCFRGSYRGRKNSSNYKALPRIFDYRIFVRGATSAPRSRPR